MKCNCVNVLIVVNFVLNIIIEIIDGKLYIVVCGIMFVVDDIVMNWKLYLVVEIEKVYNMFECNLMLLGYLKVDGKYVFVCDVWVVNEYYVGVWLQNVSYEDGKVMGDMYVNCQYVELSEKGKCLINCFDEMIVGINLEFIYIFIGFLYFGIVVNGELKGKKYNEIVINMMFDYVVVLFDESGVGILEEGVGIFVNLEGYEQQIEVVCFVDGIDCICEGLFNKIKFFFINVFNFFFDDILCVISDKLCEGDIEDKWLWLEMVWLDSFIYCDDIRYLKQKYFIDDDGKVVFVGEFVEVVCKFIEYEIKINGENDLMKELIINVF